MEFLKKLFKQKEDNYYNDYYEVIVICQHCLSFNKKGTYENIYKVKKGKKPDRDKLKCKYCGITGYIEPYESVKSGMQLYIN